MLYSRTLLFIHPVYKLLYTGWISKLQTNPKLLIHPFSTPLHGYFLLYLITYQSMALLSLTCVYHTFCFSFQNYFEVSNLLLSSLLHSLFLWVYAFLKIPKCLFSAVLGVRADKGIYLI